MANSSYKGTKYIVVGIKYSLGKEREVIGLAEEDFRDSAEYQQLIYSNITPEIDLSYNKLSFQDKLLGIFKNKVPHYYLDLRGKSICIWSTHNS